MRPKLVLAEVHRVLTKKEDGVETILRESSERIEMEKAEKLLGNAQAAVSRSRTVKLAVPDSYGTSIASSCTVTLSCNQDNVTLGKAAKLCIQMVDKISDKDRDDLKEFVEAMS